jgi:long-chain fatty acid transport protein
MRILRVIAILLSCLILLSATVAAGGFENINVGLKATAMGSAYRALADDWTAAYYNPAAYALINDNQLGGNAAFGHYRQELVPAFRRSSGNDSFENGFFNDRSIYNAHEVLSNPSGGVVFRLPVWGETVFGFSIYQPFDYNTTWTLFRPLPAYNTSNAIPNDQYGTNLDVVAFQFSMGKELSEEKLYFGLGLQLLRADLTWSELRFRDNPMPAPFDDRPYETIPEWTRHDGHGWGFGVRAGWLWTPTDRFNIGITGNIPSNITIDGDSALMNLYLPKVGNDGGFTIGTIENLFASGSRINGMADFETKLNLPPSFGMGVSFDVTEKLTLAIDAQYMLWSQFEGFEFTYSNWGQLSRLVDTAVLVDGAVTTNIRDWVYDNTLHPVEWENSGRVMVGANYNPHDIFSFYLGGYKDQSPARKTTQFTPNFIDTGDKNNFSGGFMFHVNEWDIGIATSYTNYPDLTLTEIDSDGDGIDDSIPGFYQADYYETVLSFIYRF